jgi:hypothetical protein
MNGMGHKPDALRSGVRVRWNWWGVRFGVTLLGTVLALSGPASAGSDNSSNTYAADANGIVIPTGTLLAIQYFGVRESDTYVTTNDNIFAKLGAGREIDSEFELFTSITRFVYFTSLFNHPLAIEAAFTGVEVSEANIGNEAVHNPATGLGPQSVQDGFLDPVFFLSYGLIAAPKDERFLVFTNYFYLPFGRYDKFANVNVAAPEQFTWVPQLALAEGLGKYGLKNFWLDVIANASLHTDGNGRWPSPAWGNSTSWTRTTPTISRCSCAMNSCRPVISRSASRNPGAAIRLPRAANSVRYSGPPRSARMIS